MSFFRPSLIQHSAAQAVSHALDQGGRLEGQVKRYIHLKRSIRNIAEGVRYSGHFSSIHASMDRVIQHSDRRLNVAKGFAEHYPEVLAIARNSTAKYLTELSKPRLLRSGFKSSNTIMREKINPLLSQLVQQQRDFVSTVGSPNASVSQVLQQQKDYKAHLHEKIRFTFEAEAKRQSRNQSGFEGAYRQSRNQSSGPQYNRAQGGFGTHERAAPQGGIPKQEYARTRENTRPAGASPKSSQSPKDAYLEDLNVLKSVWSSHPKNSALLETFSGVLKRAAEANRLGVDQLMQNCVNKKKAAELVRPEIDQTLMKQMKFVRLALHPDKLDQESTTKSPIEKNNLKNRAAKFLFVLDWMSGS